MKHLISSLLFSVLLHGTVYAGAANGLIILDAYVRAVPTGQPNSAAFMKIENPTTVAHAVVDARSPVANVVELHTHINEDGMMKMRRIPSIHLPAGGETVLQPGGLHVMLIGLRSDLKPGDMVDVTLVFDDGSEKLIQAPVKKITGMKMRMHKN
ncbi:MAG: copper chaperone PCu(A)C [bacterium]